MGYFKAKQEHAQELARMTLQAQIVKEQSQMHLEEVRTQGDIARDVADLAAIREAVKAQGKPIGVAWVDAWNAAMRPGIATALVLFYIAIKIAAYTAVDAPAVDALRAVWTEFDGSLLSAVTGFFFMNRTLMKMGR